MQPLLLIVASLFVSEAPDEKEAEAARKLTTLVERLKDGRTGSDLAYSTMKKVARHGPSAVPPMIDLLKRGGRPRLHAVRVLAMIGKPAKEAVGPLVEIFEKETDTRGAIAYALAMIGPDARTKAAPALIPLLGAPYREAHDFFYALERIGIDAKDVPAVLKHAAALEDVPRLAHRYPLVLAWGGKGAVPALVEAVGHEKPHVRDIAIRSLGKIGPDAKTDAAVKALVAASKDAGTRVAAAEALVAIGASARVAVPGLIRDLETTGRVDLLRSTELRYTCPAAVVLGRIPEAVPALVEGLDSDKEMVRIGCLVALSAHGKKAEVALPSIKKILATSGAAKARSPDDFKAWDFAIAAVLKLDPDWVRKAVEAGPEPKASLPPSHLRQLIPALALAASRELDAKPKE